MSSSFHDLGYSIKELVSDLADAADPKEGIAILKKIGSLVGLPKPTLVDNVLDDQLTFDLHQYCGWPDEMLRWWFTERVCEIHRDTRRCLVERLPFRISAREAYAEQLTEAEKLCRQRFMHFGIISNLIVPVHLPNGITSLVGWASSEESAADRPLVQQFYCELIAAAHSFVDLLERNRPQSKLLRPRERECIQGVAAGKNYKEIARDLQLSPLTVCDYLANAAKRLGARNRGHLVSLALRSGELWPDAHGRC